MNELQSIRLTILLGAGASYGCGARSRQPNTHFLPPLAKDLFSPIFESILAIYPRVQQRTDEIRSRLANGENIEAILRDLYQSAEKNSRYWPFQIPLYLRVLLWVISEDYSTGSTKYDTLIRQVLDSEFSNVMFLNLNYDLFLDRALEGYASHRFATLDSYVSGDKWFLIKPHGSVNWAQEIDNCPRDHSGQYANRLDEVPHFRENAETKVIMWNRHSIQFYVPGLNTDGYLYPQLIIPADKPKEFVCPQSHVERAIEFIQHCKRFIIIGFSGHDDDINSLLDLMPEGSQVMVVGSGKDDAKRTYETICAGASSLKSKKVQSLYYNNGFASFLESKDLRAFMASRLPLKRGATSHAGITSRKRRC